MPEKAITPDPHKKMRNVAVTPRRERAAPAKSLVTIPAEQLEDLEATGSNQVDDDEKEDVMPDLSMDYFLLLENTFATFADRRISLEDLEDLVLKSNF